MRLTSLTVAVGICASIFPLPLDWHAPPGKDLSAPFPCQHRACGCKSAQHCWKRCCCFTNTQKLAWARAHKIPAPFYVVVAAASEQTRSTGCGSTGSLAKGLKTRSSADENPSNHAVLKNCCRTEKSTKACNLKTKKSGPEEHGSQFVLSILWQKCQGHNWFWNSLPWAIVQSQQSPPITLSVMGSTVTSSSYGGPQLSLSPPVPPPR